MEKKHWLIIGLVCSIALTVYCFPAFLHPPGYWHTYAGDIYVHEDMQLRSIGLAIGFAATLAFAAGLYLELTPHTPPPDE